MGIPTSASTIQSDPDKNGTREVNNTGMYTGHNKNKSADYDGVMGGFANLSQIDINFSKRFMQSLAKLMPNFHLGSVLDCGTGVGRISKDLLSHLFKTVNLQIERLMW